MTLSVGTSKFVALMTDLAGEWPHYVLPPVNPLTFLHPDNPCSFFGV